MTKPSVTHDHIILLLNTPEFNSLPAFLTTNFNIIEGGTHSGGSSRNKLIIFADGTYIELFNWITKPVEFFDWSNKAPGLIDFALTTLPPGNATENFKGFSDRLRGTKVVYNEPLYGGRKRKDGRQVSWEITRPRYPRGEEGDEETTQIDLPFFCHDVTPRNVRVPSDNAGITSHPCGATGIAEVEVLVPGDRLGYYAEVYGAVVGVEGKSVAGMEEAVEFVIGVPDSQAVGRDSAVVRLRAASTTEDEEWTTERGAGIRRVLIATAGKDGIGGDRSRRKLDEEGIGESLVLIS